MFLEVKQVFADTAPIKFKWAMINTDLIEDVHEIPGQGNLEVRFTSGFTMEIIRTKEDWIATVKNQ